MLYLHTLFYFDGETALAVCFYVILEELHFSYYVDRKFCVSSS